MKLKLNLIAAAVALASAGAANAALTLGSAAPGSSSVVFVAVDQNSNPTTGGPGNSLTIDLGNLFADFIAQSGTQGVASGAFAAGSLSAPGTSVVWDFLNNTRSINGGPNTTTSYSDSYTSFLSAVAGSPGNSYSWGVIGGDRVAGTTTSSSNVVANFNLLATGTPTGTVTSGQVSNGTNNLVNFLNASNGLGTQTAGVIGANTSTAGTSFLGTTMRGNFGGQIGWNYLSAPGSTTTVQWIQQGATSSIYQLGQSYALNGPSSDPATFTFDNAAGTLTYVVPVPEPEGITLAMAGLAALGFVARRRRRQA